MFSSLPAYLKAQKLHADVRVLLLLKKSLEKGLVHTFGDLYVLLRSLITGSPEDIGPFTVAFYDYFLGIEIKKGETLTTAILRSEAFRNWLKANQLEKVDAAEKMKLAEQYIDQIHLTTYDIQTILSGKEVLKQDDPNRKDTLGEDDEAAQMLDRMADYSNVSLEELLERMRQVLQQQKQRHAGGNHWVGTGGISPFGAGGAAMGGIRVGGTGGGKMARQVVGDSNFYPVNTKVGLTDNNIDVALSFLKGIQEETVELLLDIPATIEQGVKAGGLFLPYEKEKRERKVQVLLFIDNGGWSMSPYVAVVTKLFAKMKRRFAHDLKTYYFHNTLHSGAYKEASRRNASFERIEKICTHHKNYAVFIIGDADMAPYELSSNSLNNWWQIRERFVRSVWLNPVEPSFWKGSDTIPILQSIFEMFPLSPYGIEKAVEYMNRKRQFQ